MATGSQRRTMTKALQLITFDATNTFLHFSLPVYEQYAQVARHYNVVVDNPQRLQQYFEKVYARHWKSRPNFGCLQPSSPTAISTSQRWWMDVVRDTFLLGGYATEGSTLDALAAHLYRHFCLAEAWRVDAEFPTLTQALREQFPSMKFGVISNFDERLEIILRAVGCLHLFDFVLTSVAAGAAKPSLEIFNFALRDKAGLELPNAALHVGNDLKRDYYGALNAGWNVLLYAPPPQAVTRIDASKPEEKLDESRDKEAADAITEKIKLNKIEQLSDLIGYVNQNFHSGRLNTGGASVI